MKGAIGVSALSYVARIAERSISFLLILKFSCSFSCSFRTFVTVDSFVTVAFSFRFLVSKEWNKMKRTNTPPLFTRTNHDSRSCLSQSLLRS